MYVLGAHDSQRIRLYWQCRRIWGDAPPHLRLALGGQRPRLVACFLTAPFLCLSSCPAVLIKGGVWKVRFAPGNEFHACRLAAPLASQAADAARSPAHPQNTEDEILKAAVMK